MNQLVRRLATSLAASLVLVAGCSAAGDGASEPSGASADELATPALRACPAADRYGVIAFADGGPQECPDVAGTGGTWRAPPPTACTPAKAPGGTDPFLCQYEWTASRGASPDVGALQAIAGVYVAPIADATSDPTCGDGTFSPWLAAEDQAGVTCPFGPKGPNGPKGCDVCNLQVPPGVIGGWLVVPASTPVTTVGVSTSNGSQQMLMLQPSVGARAATTKRARASSYVILDLPSLPRGLRYVEGPVRGYGYSSAPKSP